MVKKRKWTMSAGIILVTIGFLAFGIGAAEFTEMIEMKNPAYEKHTKGIVMFSHAKHYREYKADCGECHHDDKGKPIEGLKEGDDVQSCIECHKIPSERPKGKDAPKLSKKERLEYHAEALHYNCKDCHKAFNKKNKTKKAPTTCKKCHPKIEK